MNPVSPISPVLTLGEEVRADAPLFIEAACRQFKARFQEEYHRLRGYAHESGATEAHLNVGVTLSFAPGAKSVTIETVPDFVPLPLRSREAIEPAAPVPAQP